MLTQPRRITLFDAMILVGATAVGFAIGRAAWMALSYGRSYQGERGGWYVFFAIGHGLTLASPVITAWMVGLLIVRLRYPRPRLRRIARQPGVVACCAAMLPVLAYAALYLAVWVINPRRMSSWEGWAGLPTPAGFAVAGAWLALALSGRWQAEAGWIDRAGRVLGACWIVMLLIYWTRFFVV